MAVCTHIRERKRTVLPRTAIRNGFRWFDYLECCDCGRIRAVDKPHGRPESVTRKAAATRGGAMEG